MRWQVLGTVLAAILEVSCAARIVNTYGGPERPREQIGVLSIAPPIQLTAIDGNVVPRGHTRIVRDDSYQIHFLPGHHTITVHLADPKDLEKRAALQKSSWQEYDRTPDTQLSVEVEPGHSYRVYFELESDELRIWIEQDHGRQATPNSSMRATRRRSARA